MQSFTNETQELLIKICEKHNVKPSYLQELLSLESTFSLKNAVRSTRLKEQMKQKIQQWADEIDLDEEEEA